MHRRVSGGILTFWGKAVPRNSPTRYFGSKTKGYFYQIVIHTREQQVLYHVRHSFWKRRCKVMLRSKARHPSVKRGNMKMTHCFGGCPVGQNIAVLQKVAVRCKCIRMKQHPTATMQLVVVCGGVKPEQLPEKIETADFLLDRVIRIAFSAWQSNQATCILLKLISMPWRWKLRCS